MRRSVRLFVVFALAAFLLCVLVPHLADIEAATTTGASNGSVAASSAVTPSSAAPNTQMDTSSMHGGQEQEPHHTPVCHTSDEHVMDVAKRVSSLVSSDVLGLLGALLIALVGLSRWDACAKARWWSTRPPGLLAGFPLLIALGVSRT